MDIKDVNKAFDKGKKKSYLSPKIESLMNSLIAAEFNASQLYESMGVWCEYTGFEGTAKYLTKQVGEERVHMHKLYEFALDRQALPITPAVKMQPNKFVDLKDVLEKSLAHEELIEDMYKKAVDLAMSEKDMTTFSFLQWFLLEQIEEIKVYSGFLDRLEVIGNDKKGQYFLDKEIGCIA